ncbi:hypothetical protein BVRB_8g196970 [Beta vulgaris subsp. vulgaris]|nr:hypothetical protein BVRB_8g196970 [Beta vulgaris subsp. vulgaris]
MLFLWITSRVRVFEEAVNCCFSPVEVDVYSIMCRVLLQLLWMILTK